MADKPVHDVRIGNIKGSIWSNKKDDKEWFSYTVQRSYKDKNGEWQNTSTLSSKADILNNILVLMELGKWSKPKEE